jgi:hypothetical protein
LSLFALSYLEEFGTLAMNEHEYKKWLDTISPSFCGAKWYNATIWLGSGQTTSCYHPKPHQIDLEAIKTNPSAIHNTPTKKAERAQMLRGERPEGCAYCWRMQDTAPQFLPDRVWQSRRVDKDTLMKAVHGDPNADYNLTSLEIAFDRTCNFACSYCNPGFSTTWVKDIKEMVPMRDCSPMVVITLLTRMILLNVINMKRLIHMWKRSLSGGNSDLHKSLDELRITGGEPLMSMNCWRLIEWFINNKDRSKTKLALNSNLSAKPELIDKLIEVSNAVDLSIYTSAEGWVPTGNIYAIPWYSRTGSKIHYA